MACLVKKRVLGHFRPPNAGNIKPQEEGFSHFSPQTLEILNLKHSKNPSTLFYEKRKLMITAKFSEIDHSVFEDDNKAPASDRQVSPLNS